MTIAQITRVVLIVCGTRFGKTVDRLERIPMDGEKGFPIEVFSGKSFPMDVQNLVPEIDDHSHPTFVFSSDDKQLLFLLNSAMGALEGWQELGSR